MSATLTSLGSVSKVVYLAEESRKLSQEFTASGAVKKGTPVKLTNAGLVIAWAKTDLQHLCIGFCLSDQADQELVTVYMRGFAIVWGLSNAAGAQNAGPATYNGYDTTHNAAADGTLGYGLWGAATDVTDAIGWMLDAATAQYQYVRVVLKD